MIHGMMITERMLPDGRVLTVYPQCFGTARLLIASPLSYELGFSDDGW